MFETVGIVAKQNDPRVIETCQSLVAYLRARDIPHLLDPVCAAAVPGSPEAGAQCADLGRACDLVLVVGGDGTLLKTARLLVDHDVRLLGINLGRVGFLTDVSRHEMAARLDEIFSGRFQEEIRFLLEAQVARGGATPVRQDALNDVVVQKGNVARLVRLDTFIDGRFVSSQRSDGLIVATPTGSTAYALSGGGPLLHPSLNAIVLVPICPHTLSNRPIVVDADSLVEVVVGSGQATTALLTCDGDTVADLVVGDRVLVRKRDRAVRLIHPPGHDYFGTLRTKLHWAKEL
jgi:NAD+ kinase